MTKVRPPFNIPPLRDAGLAVSFMDQMDPPRAERPVEAELARIGPAPEPVEIEEEAEEPPQPAPKAKKKGKGPSPEELARQRRSGSRRALYTRERDGVQMTKVGFSATHAFDLELEEFCVLLVDDDRNQWMMRVLQDAMAEQRPQLVARRQRLKDLARRQIQRRDEED
jgi:hypothetical protein